MPHEHLMLAATRAEVALLNRLAQETRMRHGNLRALREGPTPLPSGAAHFRAGKEIIYESDRVMLTRNCRYYGVENGNLGTLARIDQSRGTVTIRLDDKPRPVTVSLERYNRHGAAIRLGYAATTHKAQGASVRYVYVLAGADRELTYVQTSRARDVTRLYTDEIEAGPELAALARTMSKSHQKDLFRDLAETPPARTLPPGREPAR
jgi:ATP-dependent exoDNAse (exonuclease V) alpha subunit